MKLILILSMLTVAPAARAAYLNCEGTDPSNGMALALTSTDETLWPVQISIDEDASGHVAEVEREDAGGTRVYTGNPKDSDGGLYAFDFRLAIDASTCKRGDPVPRCASTMTSSIYAGGHPISLACAIDVVPPPPPLPPGECNHPHCH